MRFAPKSEKQIQEERFPVIKPGRYPFEVIDAEEKISKNGNPMIVLKLKISDNINFNPICFVTDYLMESIAHKLRHAAFVCGLGNAYDSGELTARQFAGKTGMVDIGIQKDKSGQYPDKNQVNDYIIEDPDGGAANKAQGGGSDWDNMQEPPEWAR